MEDLLNFNVGDIVAVQDKVDLSWSAGVVKMIEPDDEISELKWIYVVSDIDDFNTLYHPAIGNYYTLRPMKKSAGVMFLSPATTE